MDVTKTMRQYDGVKRMYRMFLTRRKIEDSCYNFLVELQLQSSLELFNCRLQ